MHGSEFDIFYDEECTSKQKEKVCNVFAMADIVIALSEEWKEYLEKICPPDKVIVLYNAIKIPSYKRENYNDKNVLFLGRLGKRKGAYDLISAIPSIVEQVPQVHFYLAGDGELDACKEMCDKLNISDFVTFLGWIKGKQKEEYLKKCSTYVLPSYHEGMPMSLLEAMSYGEVVISTNVGGIPKVIEQGKNGYIIEAGNLNEMVETITTALISDKREIIGAEAYETVFQQFNIEKNVELLIEIYKKLIIN